MFSLLQSHLSSGTESYVRQRVHCAFAKILNKQKRLGNGRWMDGWMGAGQDSLSVLAQEKVTQYSNHTAPEVEAPACSGLPKITRVE